FLCPPELCSAPPVTGPCRAAFPRWFYVPAEKSCREFTYGGCRGNANNHRDERECLRQNSLKFPQKFDLK
uniref:BPTI/Kunitz inhibitor domain-containing protein n=1 Tax=Serinus canaria TaxID=9135 RepID=A0A8C9L2V7_SERCA